jgi:putative inorganic carbon (hco3(-)) transporter
MLNILQTITLTNIPLYQWRKSSFAYRIVGFLNDWKNQSWLLQWSEGIGAIIISLILVVSPFVSTTLIGILLLMAGAFWGLLLISEKNTFGGTPIHILVFLYWGCATLSTILSPVKRASISGWLQLTLYCFMFALCAKIFRSPKVTNWVIGIFLLVSLIVSCYGIRQQFFGVSQLATWNDPNSMFADQTRVYSYLGNPNLLASYLFSAVALSLGAIIIWQNWLPKILALTMLIVNTACLYFTGSRGGWMGMIVLFTIFFSFFYYWYKDKLHPFWRVSLIPLVVGGFSILFIGAILRVESLQARLLSMFVGREDSSNNFRINVWESVMEMIKDYPITGIGVGHDAFNQVYPLYMQPRFTALSAYSIYLETLVEMGIIGFTSFIWLLIVTFTQGIIQIKKLKESETLQGFWLIGAIAACGGILTHGFADTVWYRPQVNTLWWMMIALIASQYPIPSSTSSAEAEDSE